MSTRYSPVRHSTWGRSPVRVRLACVKHAASVQSEPESNSPVQILYKILAQWAKIGISKISFPLAIHLSMNHLAFRPRLPFSVGARSVYAPFRFQSQLLFSFPAKFLSALRCQKPFLVAKPECSRTPPLCQHTFAKKFPLRPKCPSDARLASPSANISTVDEIYLTTPQTPLTFRPRTN